jgi:hypothetical protein
VPSVKYDTLGLRVVKKPAKKASDAERKEYRPTSFEAQAMAAYRASLDKRAPRLKVTADSAATNIKIDHSDLAYGQFALLKALGTTDLDFFDGLIGQLVNASSEKGASEKGTNCMLAVVKGLEPRDQIESMLAAQMAAVQMAMMTFSRRLAHIDNIQQQDSAERAFNKLARTFAAQISTLKEYRSKGEQKMTVVHVADGGQAIVGNVSAPAPGGGVNEKTGERPHALAYAPGVEMPSQIEAERATVPIARRARGSVCRMHGARGGAPMGNKNALKHGACSAEALALTKRVQALARMARELRREIE